MVELIQLWFSVAVVNFRIQWRSGLILIG